MSRTLLAVMLVMMSSLATAQPTFQSVAAARIVAAARAQLDAQLGSDRTTAQVSIVGTPADVVVLPGAVLLKAHPITGHWPRARVGVPVDVSVDGQVVRAATVWFALSVHQQVLSYAANATLGESAASLKLAPRDTDIAAVQGDVVKDPHEVEGMRLRHAVLADAVAVREDFERTPDVDRQERVAVIVAMGSIHMETKGTAISKGNTGDVVPVLVDAAETPVNARITDKGVVEVVQ